MVGINNVTIIGNIGKISDVMTTTNGSRFINMTIATTETYYSVNKEKKSNTQWHNVIFWNNMTELNKIVSKGDLLYIEDFVQALQIVMEKETEDYQVYNVGANRVYSVLEVLEAMKRIANFEIFDQINN